MDLVVIPAQVDDANGISKVMLGCALREPKIPQKLMLEVFQKFWTPDKVEAWINSQDRIILVAKENSEVVGLIGGRKAEADKPNRLIALYVDPSHHRQKIGTKLWETILTYFDLTKPVMVYTESYNDGAIKFYEHLGFKLTGKTKDGDLGVGEGKLVPEVDLVFGAK